MWHHLERSDIKAQGEALSRSGALDLNYYDLSPEEKLRDLIDRVFPFPRLGLPLGSMWLTRPLRWSAISIALRISRPTSKARFVQCLLFSAMTLIPLFPISTMRETPVSTRRRISDGVRSDPIATRLRLNWCNFSRSDLTAASPFGWDGFDRSPASTAPLLPDGKKARRHCRHRYGDLPDATVFARRDAAPLSLRQFGRGLTGRRATRALRFRF